MAIWQRKKKNCQEFKFCTWFILVGCRVSSTITFFYSIRISIWRKCKKYVDIFKGQIISKGLYGVLEFSQKLNDRISKNEFVRSFFGRIRGYQKSFQNYLTFSKWYFLWDLSSTIQKLLFLVQINITVNSMKLKKTETTLTRIISSFSAQSAALTSKRGLILWQPG